MKRAILIIDHGSRRPEANAVVEELAGEVERRAPRCVVRFAHMELAPPSVAQAVDACAAAGARELVVHPCFLGPGNHSREDIPRLVGEAAARHPGLAVRFTGPLGPDPRLAEVVLDRVGAAAGAPGRPVDVYYDYGSPYCYFALHRIDALVERHAARLSWKPIELESLASFAGPGPYSESKRRYVVADVVRSAEFLGIPLETPEPFPVRSGLALRGALVVQELGSFPAYHHAVFRAAWAEGRDIGDERVLLECARDAGADPERFLARATSGEIERAAAALARDAERAGVFGVPTMVLDGELFWGNERLDVLAWRLGGG